MDKFIGILEIVAIFLVFVIIALIFIYFLMLRKEKKGNEEKEKSSKPKESSYKKNKEYTKLSVFDFMKFDKIEDNMIIQDNETRYLMVVECEGINYDLMSEIEKVSVEQGFLQFLNTLRHPIQLYIQTRTINISSSIENYTNKLNLIKQELIKKQNEYNKLLQSEDYNRKIINSLRVEIARLQNLYDYGKDIVANTEKTSLNKNVLRKHYYIIISYHISELGSNIVDEEEKRNMIFSELYTRAQSIIRTLFACSMKGKVLDSNELTELLYVSYNRDESEVYGVDKAIRAGYTELYSTAQDVLDKKMQALDNKINEKALEKARVLVDEIRTEKEKAVIKKEKSLDELVDDLAKIIIDENKKYVGEDVAKEAIARIDNTKEEVKKDEQKTKKTRRSTK